MMSLRDPRYDEMRKCRCCGGDYTASFFTPKPGRRFRNSRVAIATRDSTCKACRQTARDRRKAERRARVKAQRTLRTHWQRYCKKTGERISQSQFAERFGWDLDQMAHDIEHAAGNGCPYCHRAFALMEGGLHNVSLDIIDPRDPPYYSANVRWVCKTCNSAKGDMTLAQFGEHLANWKKWERRQAQLHEDPWLGTLFENTDLAA